MIKATKYYIVVFLALILAHTSVIAQYYGGSGDGAITDPLNLTSCTNPPHFYAYLGGTGDGAKTDLLTTTTCSTPPQFFAYMGGTADGAVTNQLNLTSCTNPAQFYAYLGGTADGAGMNQLNLSVCSNPSQFYAYFGGSGDGATRDSIIRCPTSKPVADFSANVTTICSGTTVNFTDLSTNSPAGWTWTFTGGTPSTSTVQNPSITYNTPGTYSVKLKAVNFIGIDSIIKTGYITVNAVPTANAGIDVAICNGSSTNLSAGSGTSFSWNPATGLSSAIIANPVASPVVTTNYTVTVTTNGCSATDVVVVTVNPIPTANAGSDVAVCNGSSTTLSASGGTSFSWSPSTGLNSSVIASPVASPTSTTNYTVTVTSNNCSATDIVVVTVNPVPTATITANGPIAFCQGDSVVLTSSTGSSYLWSNLATTQAIKVFASGNYSVTVTGANGCFATSAITGVTVYSTTSASITPGGPTTFCAGDSVTLTSSSGSGYLWSNTATTQSIKVGASGTYSVTVSNIYGCPPSTASAVVTVNPNPAAPVITANGSTNICIGDTVVLTSSGANSYLWNPGGVTTQSLNVTTAGTFSVIAYNSFGCGTVSSGTIVNVNDPLVDFTGSPLLVFTPTATVNFSATTNGSGPFTYLWDFGDASTSGVIAPSHTYGSIGSETVSLTVTDNNDGCSKTITKPAYIDVEQLFPSYALVTGTVVDLTGLAFADPANGIFTLTDGNCIITSDSGITWSPLITGNILPLTGTSFISGNWFLTGNNGLIMHSINNGGTWNTYSTGTIERFNASAFSSVSNGFAVGTNGTIQKFNGSAWTPQTSGALVNLNSVAALSNGNAFAVGDNQTILYYNGSSWSPQTAPVSFNARGIKFSSTLSGYAVGTNGVIIKTIDGGVNWTPSLSGVDVDFNSVEVAGADSAWATGTGGIIYTTIDNGLNWIRYSVGNTSTQTCVKFSNGRGHISGHGGNARTFGETSIMINTNAIEKTIHDFKVYPNPASDKVVISVMLSKPANLTIELKDAEGKLLKVVENSIVSGKYTSEINTEHFSSGTYFIHIHENEKSWVQKLVILK